MSQPSMDISEAQEEDQKFFAGFRSYPVWIPASSQHQ